MLNYVDFGKMRFLSTILNHVYLQTNHHLVIPL